MSERWVQHRRDEIRCSGMNETLSQKINGAWNAFTRFNPYVRNILRQISHMREKGLCEEAIGLCDMVLTLDPCNPSVFHAKGKILEDVGKLEEAVSCYHLALEFDPFNAETWYNLGVILSRIGDPEEGARCIHQGVSLGG